MSDLIKREDVVSLLTEHFTGLKDDLIIPLSFFPSPIDYFRGLINQIPTAEPKVGKWEAKSFHECFCDNCGFSFDIMKCDFLGNMKHCPNCGAKMERSE